ncbi:MAG: 50S ribosomal protein L25 [Ignavibacteriales bacterium CG18_big_fil_WC_8_21_14_2_50_31_20]|nr:MAG: 50S ribosomal protein L25 [Ignavibacteriales bacterium CG18_big_fil_WC_8_21_14_2_50_31_20]
MAERILKAKKREISTKGAINQLRKSGFVPGIYYSKGKEQITFSVEEVALNKFVFTSETGIIQLSFDGEEQLGCVIKDIQFDPVTDKVVHFDVQGVTLGQLLQIELPISLVGSAIGVKDGGILQEQTHKLEVECLPRDIPQHIEVDISGLKIGESIHVRDLKLDKIEILNSEDTVIVSIVHPKVEEASESSEGITEEE